MTNDVYNLEDGTSASCKMNGLSLQPGNIITITIRYNPRATESGRGQSTEECGRPSYSAPLVDDEDTDSEQGHTTPVYSPSEASRKQSTFTVCAATTATQSSLGFI